MRYLEFILDFDRPDLGMRHTHKVYPVPADSRAERALHVHKPLIGSNVQKQTKVSLGNIVTGGDIWVL